MQRVPEEAYAREMLLSVPLPHADDTRLAAAASAMRGEGQNDPCAHAREEKKQRKGRPSCATKAEEHVLPLSNVMTAPFFVLLSIILCIGISVAYAQLRTANRLSLRNVHQMEKQVFELRQNLVSARVYDMGSAYAALRSYRIVNPENASIIEDTCALLDSMDDDYAVRALNIISSTQRSQAMCTHGDTRLPSLQNLTGIQTLDEIAQDCYLVDSRTRTYAEPRIVVDTPLPDRKNMSDFFDEMQDPVAFPLLGAYQDMLAGRLSEIPVELYWRRPGPFRNLLTFHYPFSLYDTEQALQSGVKDGIAFAEVRIEGRRFASMPHFDINVSGVRLMALIPPEDDDVEPLVMSNNWGQPVVDRTYPYGIAFDSGDLDYLKVSEVTDPLMKLVLKAVDMDAFTHAEGYAETGTVRYQDGTALFTAWQYTTPLGMEGYYIIATPFTAIAKSPNPTFRILGGCFVIVVVLLTVLFWVVVECCLARPLRQMGHAMRESAFTKRRTTTRMQADRGRGLVRLAEVDALLETYNDTMQSLAQLDTFIPRDKRRELLNSDDRSTASDTNSAMTASRSSAGLLLAEFPMTSVTVYLYASVGVRVGAGRRKSLDKGKHSFNGVNGVSNRTAFGAVVNPFTPAMMGEFVYRVEELAEQYGGAVHRCTPEVVVVYFYRNSMRATLLAERMGSGAGSGATMDTLQSDAANATLFAVALLSYTSVQQRHTAKDRVRFPNTNTVIDTKPVVFGNYGGEHSAAVARNVCTGRDPALDLGIYLPYFKPKVVMTEETALLVRDVACVIPIEALYVGKSTHTLDYAVVLYEVLPGLPQRPAWQAYAACFSQGFACMLRGDYGAALECFDQVTTIPDIEPGLLPCPSRQPVKAGSSANLDVTFVRTRQLDRLINVCVEKVMMRDNRPYVRYPLTTEVLRRLNATVMLDRRGDVRGNARDPGEDTGSSGAGSSVRGSYVSEHVSNPLTSSFPFPGSPERACSLLLNPQGLLHRPLGQEAPPVFSPVVGSALVKAGVRDGALATQRPHDAARASWPGSEGTRASATTTRTFTDNHGGLWLMAIRSGGAMEGDGVFVTDGAGDVSGSPQVPFALSTAGTLSRVRIYRWRSSAVGQPKESPKEKSGGGDPYTSSSLLERCDTLFNETLIGPHTVGYLGYSAESEHGALAITEYFPGGNLRETMLRYGRTLPASVVTKYTASMLAGLQFLHERGVVHGDVRPENVLVGTEGHGKLKGFFGDYTLAHRLLVLRASSYVSPEVARGGLETCASDVYRAGLVVVEMLTSRVPWRWRHGLDVDRSAAELCALVTECGDAFRRAVGCGDIVPALPVPAEVSACAASASLIAVAEAALLADAADRPSAEDLMALL